MTADFLSFFSPPKLALNHWKVFNGPLLGHDPPVENHRSKWMLLLPLWMETVVALIQIPLFSSEVLVTHQISCLLLLVVNQFERRSPGARLACVRSRCLQRRYYLSHRQTGFFFFYLLLGASGAWGFLQTLQSVFLSLWLCCAGKYTGY